MKLAATLAASLVLGIVAAVLYTAVLAQAGDSPHTCQAPCRVTFAATNMQEDMFRIDYHGKVLDVFPAKP